MKYYCCVYYLPDASKDSTKESWDGQRKIKKCCRPHKGSLISIKYLNVRKRVAWGTICIRTVGGGRIVVTEDGMGGGKQKSTIFLQTKKIWCHKFIDHCHSSSQNRLLQNDRHLGALIYVENKKLTWDEEFTHVDWNVLQHTYRSLDGAICTLFS